MIVDWQTYYDAASECHQLADDIRRADKPVHDSVKGECAGMAGDAPGCKDWGGAYDEYARATMQACSSLANALSNYAAVLYAQGYNWGVTNKSDPPPSRPSISQVGEYKVVIPTSVSNNGLGFTHQNDADSFFDKLVRQVEDTFGKLPNGDLLKIEKAYRIWMSFAANPTITDAHDRIMVISDHFIGMDDATHRQEIQNRLSQLQTSAKTVALATEYLSEAIYDYFEATNTLGTSCADRINRSESRVGVTAVARCGVSGCLFDLALSPTDPHNPAKSVSGVMDAIQSAYQASSMPDVLNMRALDARASGTDQAFKKVRELDLATTALRLSEFNYMQAILVDESGQSGGGISHSEQARARAVHDIVTDDSGALIGEEDAQGVQLVSAQELEQAHKDLLEKLGPPQVKHTPKGDIEVWEISKDPKSNVTYRPFSQSGGETLDFNDVPGVNIKRWHIK